MSDDLSASPAFEALVSLWQEEMARSVGETTLTAAECRLLVDQGPFFADLLRLLREETDGNQQAEPGVVGDAG